MPENTEELRRFEDLFAMELTPSNSPPRLRNATVLNRKKKTKLQLKRKASEDLSLVIKKVDRG